MRRGFIAAISVALIWAALDARAAKEPATEQQVAAARAVVSTTMDAVLTVVRNAALDETAKRSRIQDIAYERFDFEIISRLVLGRNIKKLSEHQRADFLEEFKHHLSLTYGRQLAGAGDEEIEIRGARAEKKGDVTVQTRIVGGKAKDGVTIDYRMRPREDSWYVIDVVIEGISLISNFRSQVQEIVSTHGADSLIEKLRKKNERNTEKDA